MDLGLDFGLVDRDKGLLVLMRVWGLGIPMKVITNRHTRIRVHIGMYVCEMFSQDHIAGFMIYAQSCCEMKCRL